MAPGHRVDVTEDEMVALIVATGTDDRAAVLTSWGSLAPPRIYVTSRDTCWVLAVLRQMRSKP